MNFIDTHTHLYSDEFNTDIDQVISNAIHLGVHKFFLPSIDSGYTKKMYDLEKKYPNNIFLMMGLHPTHVKDNYKEELAFVENELNKRKFYAVGEIGIDLYWDKSTIKIQQDAFQHQIKLAKKHNLPINIHCRDAFNEIFDILEQEKNNNLFGIFHCFTGDYNQAQKAISYNMKLGIGGVATFKNGKIDTFLNKIPLKNIVLETDSPYLAPAPYRGKRNSSEYIPLIAQKLSEIYDVSLEEIANITTKNAQDIYGF